MSTHGSSHEPPTTLRSTSKHIPLRCRVGWFRTMEGQHHISTRQTRCTSTTNQWRDPRITPWDDWSEARQVTRIDLAIIIQARWSSRHMVRSSRMCSSLKTSPPTRTGVLRTISPPITPSTTLISRLTLTDTRQQRMRNCWKSLMTTSRKWDRHDWRRKEMLGQWVSPCPRQANRLLSVRIPSWKSQMSLIWLIELSSIALYTARENQPASSL